MPATRKNLGTYNITRVVIFCKSALALDKVYQSGILDFTEAEEDRGKRGPLPAHLISRLLTFSLHLSLHSRSRSGLSLCSLRLCGKSSPLFLQPYKSLRECTAPT